jgi:hypothetical protein
MGLSRRWEIDGSLDIGPKVFRKGTRASQNAPGANLRKRLKYPRHTSLPKLNRVKRSNQRLPHGMIGPLCPREANCHP